MSPLKVHIINANVKVMMTFSEPIFSSFLLIFSIYEIREEENNKAYIGIKKYPENIKNSFIFNPPILIKINSYNV